MKKYAKTYFLCFVVIMLCVAIGAVLFLGQSDTSDSDSVQDDNPVLTPNLNENDSSDDADQRQSDVQIDEDVVQEDNTQAEEVDTMVPSDDQTTEDEVNFEDLGITFDESSESDGFDEPKEDDEETDFGEWG